MTTRTPGTPDLTVMPLRYSADPARMIAFCRLLGMVPVVTTTGDSFAELVAGTGRLMIHAAHGSETGAVPGTTDLCLATPSADEAAQALRSRGLAVRVWDESYGRQGVLDGPGGEQIAINETQRDLYGYIGHEAEGTAADPRLGVVAVRSSADMARDTAFFDELGFEPDPGGDAWFRGLRGPGRAGVIGLHRPAAADVVSRATGTEFGDAAVVRLGFETDEDLEALAARLEQAGHRARVVEGDVRAVHVTDPDRQRLEIHPRP